MRRGGGSAKGSGFERLICKELSKALSGGARIDLFWRTALSGGRATMMARGGQRNMSQTGDICAIDPLGNWLTDQCLIECKHHRDVQFNHYLLNRGGKIKEWIETAKAQSAGKLMMLIFKQNNMPTLVFTDASHLDGPVGSNQRYQLPPPLLHLEQPWTLTLHKFDHVIEMIKQIFPAAPAVRIARRQPKVSAE